MEACVPNCLKKLIKSVIYTFYQPIHIILISTLIQYTFLDEDTFLDLVQVDKKQFRSALVNLRNDRIVKQTMRKDKDATNGSTSTYIFYHINYNSLLNSLQLRIEKIRKSLIKEEQVTAAVAAFSCNNCQKTYGDVEIAKIYNMETDEMICISCEGIVKENQQDLPMRKGKCQLARFNEQFEPFYKMIEECALIDLPQYLLDIQVSDDDIKRAASARLAQGKAAEAIRQSVKYREKPPTINTFNDQSIKITFNQTPEHKAPKPTPSWFASKPIPQPENPQPEISENLSAEILENLVKYELGCVDVPLSSSPSDTFSEFINFPDNLNSENFNELPEIVSKHAQSSSELSQPSIPGTEPNLPSLEAESEDDFFVTPKIFIGGKEYAFEDVDDTLLKSMTPTEHEAYVKALNELYNNNF